MAGDLSKLIRRIYVHKGISRLYQHVRRIKDIYKPLLSFSRLCQGLLIYIVGNLVLNQPERLPQRMQIQDTSPV